MKKWLIGAVLACGMPLSTPEARASELASLRVTLLANDEDLESSDFRTASHLGLSLRSPELGSGLRAEAELSLLLSASNAGVLNLRDNASFVRLAWRPESWGEAEGLSLTVLPLSSTRLHLGYEQPAAWGRGVYASAGSSGGGNSGVPGVEARLSREQWYVFAAAKSMVGLHQLKLEAERLSLVMAGAGVDVWPLVRLEAAGAFVQHGTIPAFALLGREERASTRAVSGRVLFHQGAPIGPGVDFALYRQDPAVFETLFAPEAYPGGLSASASLEGTYLQQTLMNPDVMGETAEQGAEVLALQARLKVDFLRVHALALHRSATFISSEVPGLPPFSAFSHDTVPQSELLLSAGVDYHFAGPRLTPGLVVRAVWPATFYTDDSPLGTPPSMSGIVVLRGPGDLSILLPGQQRQPILSARATLRWDLGSVFSAIGEAFYTHDPNRTVFDDGPTGVLELVPQPPTAVGFNALLQARF